MIVKPYDVSRYAALTCANADSKPSYITPH